MSMSFGVRVVYLDKIHWHVSCVTDVRTGQRERPTDTGLGEVYNVFFFNGTRRVPDRRVSHVTHICDISFSCFFMTRNDSIVL